MRPEQRYRVQRVFADALDQTPDQRQGFIDRACAGDETVREEVLALLRHATLRTLRPLSVPIRRLLEESDSPDAGGMSAVRVGAVLREPHSGRPRWELHEVIVSGGMSHVYVGLDRDTQTRFAAKTYPSSLLGTDGSLASAIANEARACIAIPGHVNVVPITDVQVLHGRPFLFMPYIPDGSLRTLIGKPILTRSPEFVLHCALCACYGLIHASRHGVVAHRDIKPDNLLLTSMPFEGLVPAVSDFGLASIGRTGPATHRWIGTPEYMPPEQWHGLEHAGPPADVYALGATLFELFTGRRPFGSAADLGVEEIRRRHEQDAPHLDDDIPPAAQAIIGKCLAKRPEHRFATVPELWEALASAYRKVSGLETGEPQRAWENAPRAELLMREAAHLDTLGLYSEAVVKYDAVLEEIPDHAESLANRAEALRKLGRIPAAIRDAERAAQLLPKVASVWTILGNALDMNGQRERALSCYQTAGELDPHSPWVHYDRAVALEGLGREAEAEAAYRLALQCNPDHAMAWTNLGVLRKHAGDFEEALRCLEEATRLDPRLEPAWFTKGTLLLERGRIDEAILSLTQAVVISPADPPNWRWLARAYAQRSMLRAAVACLFVRDAYLRRASSREEPDGRLFGMLSLIVDARPPWTDDTYFVPAVTRESRDVIFITAHSIATGLEMIARQCSAADRRGPLVRACDECIELCDLALPFVPHPAFGEELRSAQSRARALRTTEPGVAPAGLTPPSRTLHTPPGPSSTLG